MTWHQKCMSTDHFEGCKHRLILRIMLRPFCFVGLVVTACLVEQNFVRNILKHSVLKRGPSWNLQTRTLTKNNVSNSVFCWWYSFYMRHLSYHYSVIILTFYVLKKNYFFLNVWIYAFAVMLFRSSPFGLYFWLYLENLKW